MSSSNSMCVVFHVPYPQVLHAYELQIFTTEHMQCCKPAIRQGEPLNDPPRHMPFCILGKGSTVHTAIFCPFSFVNFSSCALRVLPFIQMRFVTNLHSTYPTVDLHIEKFNISSRLKFAQNQDCVSCFGICHPLLVELIIKITRIISGFASSVTFLGNILQLHVVVCILRFRQYFTTSCHTLHPFSASLAKYLSFSTFPIEGHR